MNQYELPGKRQANAMMNAGLLRLVTWTSMFRSRTIGVLNIWVFAKSSKPRVRAYEENIQMPQKIPSGFIYGITFIVFHQALVVATRNKTVFSLLGLLKSLKEDYN
ncbi:hypothetical protein RF11_10497 [Thelohanellus kitauei]|uniref:Uncharacterized protein n=1 Tax=Thelohanellus kitauei TaxID=669202 RepID=A0A0C2MB29_THEKT|nr:hypothetical protein RF11_10497 [Thelohanellus kitauei]